MCFGYYFLLNLANLLINNREINLDMIKLGVNVRIGEWINAFSALSLQFMKS